VSCGDKNLLYIFLIYFTLCSKDLHGNVFIRYKASGELKILVIKIYQSTLIICKNDLGIINSSSNITSVSYFCITILNNLYILSTNMFKNYSLKFSN